MPALPDGVRYPDCMRMLLLLGLVACDGKAPADDTADTDADADSDADTDTDADTDVAPTFWIDADRDGFGDPDRPVDTELTPEGTADNPDDCDDGDSAVRPGANEVCNGVDDDCDAAVDDADDSVDLTGAPLWYLDADGDGHVGGDDTVQACAAPAGAGDAGDVSDCDDADALVNPDAAEICGDGVDNNCDGAATGCRLGGGTAGDADIRYFPRASGDFAGTAVLVAELDGDGNLDLLVGAPGSELDPVHTGEVTAYTTDARGDVAYASAFGAANLGVGDAFVEAGVGGTLARIGDLDGDGADEWLGGGPGYRGHGGAWGVYAGGAVFPTTPSSTGAGVASSQCATALAAGADVTGDGAPDWAVGCPGPGAGWGEVRVYSDASTFVTITASSNGELGSAITMDDFDGDGIGDLVVGSGDEERVYWFAGPVVGGAVADLSDGLAVGTSDDGGVLAAVGDLTNDGYPDLVAGAGQISVARFFAGSAGDLLAVAVNMGEQLNAAAGGDIDGDGVQDLVIGDDAGNGEVELYYGPVGPAFEAGGWLSITGGSIDHLGSSVAAGDLDDDGLDDVVLGANGNGETGAAAGAVFVFLGVGL